MLLKSPGLCYSLPFYLIDKYRGKQLLTVPCTKPFISYCQCASTREIYMSSVRVPVH